MRKSAADRGRGFTLIELMVVMTIVATLVMLAVPRYLHSVQRSQEAVLRHDLKVMRDAIDQFHADQGRYPTSIDELVQRKYLRRIPADPVTELDSTWVPVSAVQEPGIQDVRSGAEGQALDGSAYATW